MRTKMFFSLAAASLAALAACSDSTGNGTGHLTVKLTDAPFPFSEVASVEIKVVRVDARLGDPSVDDAEDEDDMGGWTTIGTPNAVINLLDLVNGETTDIADADLPTGTYRGFRIIIDPSESSITLKDGTEPPVHWPSLAQTGIKINLDEPVTVDGDGSILVVDFDVGASFVLRGNDIRNNGLLFKPVIRGTAVDITGSASGTVRGDSATGVLISGATVEVLKAGTVLTETSPDSIVATTSTDANGAFLFGFLRPGTYVVRATPPTGSVYKPALLTGGLSVVTGEEKAGLLIIVNK